MRDWTQYSINEIKTGEENGTRLLIAFCKDYKSLFGADANCCATCPSFNEKVKKFNLKNTQMEEVENSGFKLKPMYNGIQPKFNSDPVSNANLTDEKAIELLENHPKGEGLFDELPENWEELTGGGQTFEEKVNSLKKRDLLALAEELNIDDSGTVAELKERIIENGEEPVGEDTTED